MDVYFACIVLCVVAGRGEIDGVALNWIPSCSTQVEVNERTDGLYNPVMADLMGIKLPLAAHTYKVAHAMH
jgi:hypothetical protein